MEVRYCLSQEDEPYDDRRHRYAKQYVLPSNIQKTCKRLFPEKHHFNHKLRDVVKPWKFTDVDMEHGNERVRIYRVRADHSRVRDSFTLCAACGWEQNLHHSETQERQSEEAKGKETHASGKVVLKIEGLLERRMGVESTPFRNTRKRVLRRKRKGNTRIRENGTEDQKRSSSKTMRLRTTTARRFSANAEWTS